MGEFFPDVGNPPDYPLTLDDIFEVQDTANDDNLIPPFEDAEIAQAAEWNQAISNLVAIVEDLRDSVIAGGLNPDAGDKLNDVITALSAGGGAPIIQDEGTPLAGAPHTALDFTGAGVTASDAGGSKALITIPGGGGGGGPVLEAPAVAGTGNWPVLTVVAGNTVQRTGFLADIVFPSDWRQPNVGVRILSVDVVSESIDSVVDPFSIISGSPSLVDVVDAFLGTVRGLEVTFVASGPAAGNEAEITVTINGLTNVFVFSYSDK